MLKYSAVKEIVYAIKGVNILSLELITRTNRIASLSEEIRTAESGDYALTGVLSWLQALKYAKDDSPSGTCQNKTISGFLTQIKVSEKDISWIVGEITAIVEKDGDPKTIEGQIVQDAVRLDTIGAIGIAKLFNRGGLQGRQIYDPSDMLKISTPKGESSQPDALPSSVKLFYDELLHVKDKMNTKQGKKIAVERHAFMEKYLNQFFFEWRS